MKMRNAKVKFKGESRVAREKLSIISPRRRTL